MDVTFTNVLEGARQYFQGVPAASGAGGGGDPAYSEQGDQPPPGGGGGYWQQQTNQNDQRAQYAAQQQQQQYHDHYQQQRQQYQQQQQYQHQQHQGNFQFSRPHSREAPSNTSTPNSQAHQQQQHQQQQQQLQQQHQQQQYHHQSTIKSPAPGGSPYHQTQSPSSRPASNGSHYMPNSPYQQQVHSPYQQLPRVPSREQQIPRVPSREQQIPRVPSREQQIPRVPSREQQIPRVPSREQLPRVPSREQLTPKEAPLTRVASQEQLMHRGGSTSNQYPSKESPLTRVPSQEKLQRANQYTSKVPSQDELLRRSSGVLNQYPQMTSKEVPLARAPSQEQVIQRVGQYSNQSTKDVPMSRVPSQEQLLHRSTNHYLQMTPKEASLSRVPSQEHLVQRSGSSTSQYPQVSDGYNYLQSRSYYPQAPVKSTQSNIFYKATPPTYSSGTQPQQQQPNAYYKHLYTSQDQSYTNQQELLHNSQPDQALRTTHNLPPIAAISNYHSSRAVTKPVVPKTKSYPNTTTTYSQPQSTSIIQSTPKSNYGTYPAVSQSHLSSTVVSTAGTPSYYVSANQTQSSNLYYQAPKSNAVPLRQQPVVSSNVVEQSTTAAKSASTIKRESPLDLSVKTVRTPADSTLCDNESDSKIKMYNRTSLSAHNYPQLDVSTFNRNLTERSSQLPSATAPKVEFHPNFNVPTLNHPSRRYQMDVRPSVVPEKAHSSSRPAAYDAKNVSYQGRYPTAVSVPTVAHVNSYIQSSSEYDASRRAPPVTNSTDSGTRGYQQEGFKKRPADVAPSVVPSKIAKVDTWKMMMDETIEKRFSSYKQELATKSPTSTKPSTVNGELNWMSKDSYSYQEPPGAYEQKPNNYNVTQSQYPAETSHSQTYVPSPAAHQYPGYAGYSQQQNYLQPSSRSNSSGSLNTLTTLKNTMSGAVDKRVLDLLRNSLEVKGQKKLEQQKTYENFAQHPRQDVQHPSTDVTAPLQPKPGMTGRNNVSPFTPTSFPDNSSIYKFNIPKAVDSVDKSINVDKQLADTVITNHSSSDLDGLAAFLAARIRTKGELKQGGPVLSNNNDNSGQNAIEKSQDAESPSSSSGGTSVKVKDKSGNAPRKRLFSRNEEDAGLVVPSRDKSGLRSSSETSIFDFPDSDSENDIRDSKESLEAMRKGRRSSKPSNQLLDAKPESPQPRPQSPEDDIFAKLCETFVEQLKNNPSKKKPQRRKRGVEPEVLAKLETVTKEKPLENEPEIKIKVEQKDEEEQEAKQEETVTEVPKIKEEVVEPSEVVPARPEGETSLIVKLENELLATEEEETKTEDPVFANKKEQAKKRLISSSESETEEDKVKEESKAEKSPEKPEPQSSPKKETAVEIPPFVRPAKKPSFGDGSSFYPGWEEGVYKYKKSLRMPPTLIQVTRPPQFHRLSTSLPDLDPCPQSPNASLPAETDKEPMEKPKFKKIKSESLDSDNESNSSFNLFGRKTNYDSEGSASIKSLPNTAKEMSILDRLLEKCGGKKKKRHKRKDDHSPKIIPKSEDASPLLATPSLEIAAEDDKESKKLPSPIIKTESALLGFRKSTINNFKDAFIKNANNIVGVHDQFTAVVLKSRTRKETRVLKQRATIKEVFGEDRPASAPPVTCLNEIQVKEEVPEQANSMTNLTIKQEKDEEGDETSSQDGSPDSKQTVQTKLLTKGKKKENSLLKTLVEKKIKTEVQEDIEDDIRSLDDIVIKRDPDDRSETMSMDGDDSSISGKRRSKFGKMRRKLSSGFDYIRKKKKVKKEVSESEVVEKKKKKVPVVKTPESIDDIQKEIKSWVLNKGIGETHLHRAARLGYTDVMAYCLEKLQNNPSPKDNAGYTPLHVACSRGHLEIAKLLLMYGADPGEGAQGGIRPLHESVENGFVEVTRLLLAYGADPTLATYSGLTPLALTNDETTKDFLKNHLNDIEGEPSAKWIFHGPASCFDPLDQLGYDILDECPEPDPPLEPEDIDFELSEQLLPNLYTLRGENPSDRWVLLQELSNILKIKSRDALLRQISPLPVASTSGGGPGNYKSTMRELKMSDFLEQVRCCQLFNSGEKINTRASKIALVRYSPKVKELLGVEVELVPGR